jgi:hypothetical protein
MEPIQEDGAHSGRLAENFPAWEKQGQSFDKLRTNGCPGDIRKNELRTNGCPGDTGDGEFSTNGGGVQLDLIPHPSCRPRAVQSIDVFVDRSDDSIMFDFALRGDMAGIVLGDELPQLRCDRLWETTCFEAFLRPAGSEAYFELNFAPTTQWAAYRFDSYRVGMSAAPIKPDFGTFLLEDDGIFEAMPRFHFPDLPELGPGLQVRLGLAAVIEEVNGNKSYWALAHPEGPPDFHHDACFAATLPAIGGP